MPKLLQMRKWLLVPLCLLSVTAPLIFAADSSEELPVFAREMLAAHNRVRQKVGVTPLKWSAKLATQAEDWAKTLATTGASRMQGIPGQNVAYTGPPSAGTVISVVAAWAAEAANYDHEKNACIDPKLRCNHYTQLVWRNTSHIGCAVAHDAVRDIWVCDYDPPGNNIAEKPY